MLEANYVIFLWLLLCNLIFTKKDKLLSKLEESEPEPPTSQEDECVICINARATMQTSPCGHRVVCRRCFVKTIQSAVAQRLLPLRCVICRARVNRLTSSSGTWRIQESASSYSVGGKSWASSGVPQSASSYSVGDHHHHAHNRVTQSASLYSMSSGSSCLSGTSHATSYSITSSTSSGVESSSGSSAGSIHHPHHLLNSKSQHLHHHHPSCANGCLGAVPRKPSLIPNSTINTYPGRRYTKGRIAELQNRLPPIKEFKSPAKVPTPSPVHINNPRLRYASYTKSANNSSHEIAPLLVKDTSPPRKIQINQPSIHSNKQTSKLGMTSKVSPAGNKIPTQKNGLTFMNGKADSNYPSSSKTFPLVSNNKLNSNSTVHSCPPLKNLHQDEKADNKKNETMEKKKKEEKQKLKAEKEARKEEKRIAKEEERLAKLLAKEEKKKGKKEAKELLLANDGK